jgi:predicted DNA-binding transcriptional regulator AlpA
MQITPRVIRAKDAPAYLGMSRSVFNRDVKPYIASIPIGTQGIGYDRLELDRWLEHYKHRNERPAKSQPNLGGTLWQNDNIDDLVLTGITRRTVGLSTKNGKGNDYTSSLKRIAKMKPKHS